MFDHPHHEKVSPSTQSDFPMFQLMHTVSHPFVGYLQEESDFILSVSCKQAVVDSNKISLSLLFSRLQFLQPYSYVMCQHPDYLGSASASTNYLWHGSLFLVYSAFRPLSRASILGQQLKSLGCEKFQLSLLKIPSPELQEETAPNVIRC